MVKSSWSLVTFYMHASQQIPKILPTSLPTCYKAVQYLAEDGVSLSLPPVEVEAALTAVHMYACGVYPSEKLQRV
jgi:hypothetical protein